MLNQFAVDLAEKAAELARPTLDRRTWLSVDDAIRAACRNDQRTSGNWGYWIRHLRGEVAKLIELEQQRRARASMDRQRRRNQIAA